VRTRLFALAVVPIAGLLAAPQIARHVRAATVLSHLASDAPAEVDEVLVPGGRIYKPRGVEHPPGLVLVHGVHHLGFEEPRLKRFSRTLAGAGLEVFTPQVDELADYRVDPASIETIGKAVLQHAHGGRVGLMGLSFAGGLSLVAASDPRFAPHVAYVVAVGAHDDLERVSRFFALDEVTLPDGTKQTLRAHEYGLLVLARSHVADLFAPEDQEPAREALKLWLWEDRDGARAKLTQLSEPGQQRLDALLKHDTAGLKDELVKCIENDRATSQAVSPSAHLSGLQSPALLLHGAGDNVIPPSETLWLAKHVPPSQLEDALVSPALQHVELEGEPGWGDKWRLIHFVALLLARAGE
jgi:pimeloyl-ACP methyl ester carboxylesterase